MKNAKTSARRKPKETKPWKWHYASDRPHDCEYCYWYSKYDPSRCRFGGWDHCWYIEWETNPEIPVDPRCDGCPYGRAQPCVGICYKSLDKAVREQRKMQDARRQGDPEAAAELSAVT